MKKHTTLLTAAILAFSIVLSGNGTKAEAAGDNNTLVIASLEIPATLNSTLPMSASYLRRLGAAEALFKVDENGNIVPELAESITQVDATTWDIKLQKNISFWSGKPCDADAVIASLEDSKANDTGASSYLSSFTFEKVDDSTVRIFTERENMLVSLNLSVYQTIIHNPNAENASVDTADYTGMYKITEFNPDESIRLEKNKNYWGTLPAIETVVQNQIPDEQSRILLAKSGEADIITDIPTSGVAELDSAENLRLTDAPTANPQTIYLNLQQPQLQDVRVRQALSWALDREELVLLGSEGHSNPITTWLGANPAYPEAKDAIYSTAADLEKAAALLNEAGWVMDESGMRVKDGEPLTVRLMTWGNEKALGEAIQNQWTKLGIHALVEYVDYSIIENARTTGDWDASIEAWGTFGDEYALLSGQFSPAGSANFGGYDDEETNELLEALGNASEASERHELAEQVNERVAEQAPIICLYPRPSIAAISVRLEGFAAHFRQYEFMVTSDLKFTNEG